MGKLKSKKVMQKCLSFVPAIALCGNLFCSVDLLCTGVNYYTTKKDICKQNESAYVDFVNYEVNKITQQYLDNSISFDKYIACVEDLSNEDKKQDIIIDNFATDSQKQQLNNYKRRAVADGVGSVLSLGSIGAYEYFGILKRYNDSEKEL